MPNIGKLMIRHRDVCAYCGCTTQLRHKQKPTFATVDHLHPKSKGGRRSNDNSVLACRRCNGLKGDKSLEEFLGGLSHLQREDAKRRLALYGVSA